MSDKSKISWCDATWNPVRGCTKVSAGCRNCYAEQYAHRFWGPDGFKVKCLSERLDQPLHWKWPRKIFVNSMSDLFHPDVPYGFIDKVFTVIARAKQPDFLVLTKRPERMRKYLEGCQRGADDTGTRFPWPNFWAGVSCENQETADERIPILLGTTAAHRFISLEPLLGPIELPQHDQSMGPSFSPLDWIIVGGESGPGARPCDLEWIRSIVRQCRDSGVPCYVKQLGAKSEANVPVSHCRFKVTGSGSDPSEWPEDLRVHEFPEGLR